MNAEQTIKMSPEDQREAMLSKRKAMGLTQKQMGELLGMTRAEYGWYERGNQVKYNELAATTLMKQRKLALEEFDEIFSKPGIIIDGQKCFNPEQATYIKNLLAEMSA